MNDFFKVKILLTGTCKYYLIKKLDQYDSLLAIFRKSFLYLFPPAKSLGSVRSVQISFLYI